jgi:hypothetical protein
MSFPSIDERSDDDEVAPPPDRGRICLLCAYHIQKYPVAICEPVKLNPKIVK